MDADLTASFWCDKAPTNNAVLPSEIVQTGANTITHSERFFQRRGGATATSSGFVAHPRTTKLDSFDLAWLGLACLALRCVALPCVALPCLGTAVP